jgi:hypothetical protein
MQASFSDLEYAAKKKVTRRDRFLREIDAITPWSVLVAEIAPFHPKGEGRGRPPTGVERMLRMYVAQQCFRDVGDFGIDHAVFREGKGVNLDFRGHAAWQSAVDPLPTGFPSARHQESYGSTSLLLRSYCISGKALSTCNADVNMANSRVIVKRACRVHPAASL